MRFAQIRAFFASVKWSGGIAATTTRLGQWTPLALKTWRRPRFELDFFHEIEAVGSAGLESWSPPFHIQLWGPYNRGLKAKPPAGSRIRAHGKKSKGEAHEAETLSDFRRSMETANFPTFQKCETQKIRYNLCCLCKKWSSIGRNTSQITAH